MNKRNELVESLTRYLRGLARNRTTRVVTADDAQRFIDRKAKRTTQDTRISIIRSALREPMFEAVGRTNSTREIARGRVITAWTPAAN